MQHNANALEDRPPRCIVPLSHDRIQRMATNERWSACTLVGKEQQCIRGCFPHFDICLSNFPYKINHHRLEKRTRSGGLDSIAVQANYMLQQAYSMRYEMVDLVLKQSQDYLAADLECFAL
eukprot:GEZU01001292.1.p3 GENE.GEZU01001292.1~~GEZU01001292.1.p3  ORF type:complete len:121 (-),score=18.31 GEZU01001292.1:6-368(-)